MVELFVEENERLRTWFCDRSIAQFFRHFYKTVGCYDTTHSMSRPHWLARHTTELQSSRTNYRCDVKCFPTAFPSEIQGLGWVIKLVTLASSNYITLRLRSGAMALATSRMHSPLALALSKSIGMILRKGNRRARSLPPLSPHITHEEGTDGDRHVAFCP